MNRLKHLLFPLCAVLALGVFVVEAQEPPDIPHTNWIRNLSWSPDGRYIAVARQNGLIEVVRASDQQTHITLAAAGSDLSYSVAWSPDGIAIAGGIGDSVYIWNLDGALQRTLEGHLSTISSVAWSSDGTRLASVDQYTYPHNIRMWADSGSLIFSKRMESIAYTISWSPDESRIVIGGEQYINVYASASGQPIGTIDLDDAAMSVAWHPHQNNLVASGTAAGTVYILDVDKWEILHTLSGHDDWVFGLAWNPEGSLLASSSRDGVINFWTADGELVDTLQSTDSVYAIAWHPDGSQLAYGGAGVNETVQIVAAPEAIETAQ